MKPRPITFGPSLALSFMAMALPVGSSCETSSGPKTERVEPPKQGPLISDEAHGGTLGAVLLPPLVPRPPDFGEFAPDASPTVQVDETNPATGAAVHTLATFTRATGPGKERIRVHFQNDPPDDDDADPIGYFVARWKTRDFRLSPAKAYRIRVSAPGAELAYADIKLVTNEAQFRKVDRSAYVPVLLDSVLRIKFRIERKALKCVHVTCTASDQCHAIGTCNPNTGICSNPIKANDSACNDGNACTRNDACQAGVCLGTNPVVCTASDQCHAAGTCDGATGTCSNPAIADGTPCTDGSACTQTDTCQAGACLGSNPVTCVASDQCHSPGQCNPTTGVCTNPAKPDGDPCSDGSACTQTDTCQSGTCSGTNPVVCTAADQCHGIGLCNGETGACDDPVLADGTPCNDGTLCTVGDRCQAGACVAGKHVDCSPTDQCHLAAGCDPSTGQCRSVPATCNDGNDCTQDGCDPAAGCVFVHHYGGNCNEPAPTAAVTIKDFTLLGETFHAGDGASAKISVEADAPRADYDAELLLYSLAEDEGDLPGVLIGEAHLAIEAGSHEYTVGVTIPATLRPGQYELAVHEYPDGPFPESSRTDPYDIGDVVGLPILAFGEPSTSQPVIFLGDEDIPPANATAPAANSFSSTVDLAAINRGAANSPVSAYLTVAGQTFPLLIWDATAAAYTQSLIVPALSADAPLSVPLDLVPRPEDATALRALAPIQQEVPAKVLVRVNESGSVPEAPCDAAPPDFLLCPHAVEIGASLFLPAPVTDSPDSAEDLDDAAANLSAPAAPAAGGKAAFAAPAASEPRAAATLALPTVRLIRVEKQVSKFIGNKYAGAGVDYDLSAKLATNGIDGHAGAALPVKILGVKRNFAEVGLDAVAHEDDESAYAYLAVKMLGDTVYDLRVPEQDSQPGGDAGGSAKFELPAFTKDITYSQTVLVGPIPVTFFLGARGSFLVKGTMHAGLTDGKKAAEIDYSLTPYTYIKAFGGAAVGIERSGWGLSAGIEVDLFLLEASLTSTIEAKVGAIKTAADGSISVPGTLSARSNYDFTFMRGRILAFYRFPTLKFCPLAKRGPLRKIKIFCGFKQDQHEKQLAAWPGYHLGPYTLLDKSWPLFEVPIGCLQLGGAPPNLGEPCNVCDGVIKCNGSCSTEAPPNVGERCGLCGRIQCDGSCPSNCIEEVLASTEGSATLGGGLKSASKTLDVYVSPPEGMRIGQPLGHYGLGQGVTRIGAVRVSADRDWNRVSELWVDISPTSVHVHGRIDRPSGFKAGAGLYVRLELLRNSPEDMCEDSLCETDTENRQSCPADCVQFCGDGLCEEAEANPTARCLTDCGYPPVVDGQCPAPWGDCDGNHSVCETDLTTASNCLSCGNTCSYYCTPDGCDVGIYN